MTPTSAPFLAAANLVADGADRFVGVTGGVPWPKAYGGDLLVHAAAAATATVQAGRVLHGMHTAFLRPAEIGAPVRYEVERLRDGRSYSSRAVRGYAGDQLLVTSTLSFHALEDGVEFAAPMPVGIPTPESLPSAADVLAGRDDAAARYWSAGRSFDLRHVPAAIYTTVGPGRPATQHVWLRAFDRLPDDPAVHRLALVYVCDYPILEPVLRQQGRAWSDAGLATASLDHALWLHRDGRLDEWVLYTQTAASAQHARGLATGTFHARDGRLLATVAQEGVVRGA